MSKKVLGSLTVKSASLNQLPLKHWGQLYRSRKRIGELRLMKEAKWEVDVRQDRKWCRVRIKAGGGGGGQEVKPGSKKRPGSKAGQEVKKDQEAT